MRFIKLSLLVAGAMMITSTASALNVTLSQSGGSCVMANVTAACTVDLDLKLRNPALSGVVGYGASVVIRDSGSAIVDFGAHAALSSFTLAGPQPILFSFTNFTGLSNLAPFVSNDLNSGVDVLRAFNGAVGNPAVPAIGDGLLEPATGGNGGQNGIILSMAGLLPGAYTLNLESAFGDGAIFAAGGTLTQVGSIGFTVVAIPEPTTALLMGLGLAGLASAGRRK